MTPENEVSTELVPADGGKIVFAPDVIATIASLAASEIDGIESLGGGVVDGITGMLSSKKNLTKGVKVELGTEEAALDLIVAVKYGCKIHEVCMNVQRAVKNAVETMTGLRVVEVNVSVSSISVEKTDKKVNAQGDDSIEH